MLKHLYQELIDPETRHDLGEYYTPDWLAELTVERLKYKGGRFLDPACGSGGFLFAAVNALRKAGVTGNKLVAQALDEIIGIDVHPVAVLMSKANLLLALRHELPSFGKEVTLRIYMADTLMAEEDASAGVLKIPVHGKDVFTIPFETIARGGLDVLVDFLGDFASRGSKSEEAEGKAWDGVKNHLAELSQREIASCSGRPPCRLGLPQRPQTAPVSAPSCVCESPPASRSCRTPACPRTCRPGSATRGTCPQSA